MDVDTTAATLCAQIPRLSAAPTIDGTLDAGLRLRTLDPVGWQSILMPLPPKPDITVELAIAHRPNGLYFFVDVSDPDRFPGSSQEFPYCGDGVELYVDHDGVLSAAPEYDAIGGRQFIARAPADASTSRSDGEAYVPVPRPVTWVGPWQTGVATPRIGGYSLEAFIDAPALQLASWSLASGMHVGIDIAVNLSTSDGSAVPLAECPQSMRLGQFFLHIDESMRGVYGRGAPYATATGLCFPQLE